MDPPQDGPVRVGPRTGGEGGVRAIDGRTGQRSVPLPGGLDLGRHHPGLAPAVEGSFECTCPIGRDRRSPRASSSRLCCCADTSPQIEASWWRQISYLTRAEAMEPPDVDWPWVIARARAELSELRGGLLDDLLAEYHYRRATSMVAALRSTARARSAYLVSSHRGPYDGLIALLARNGRWRDVLAVVLELDASDMLRATAAEREDARSCAAGPERPDRRARSRRRRRPSKTCCRRGDRETSSSSSRRRGARSVRDHERAYRLRIADGDVTGEDMADASTARKWADELFADPGNREAARALGRMIVPPEPTDATLHVLAIGPLGKVPLAALRDDDGSPSIARRPLVRVLALRATGSETRGAGPPVVIADPQGDLGGARTEGSVVAEALGSRVQVSGFERIASCDPRSTVGGARCRAPSRCGPRSGPPARASPGRRRRRSGRDGSRAPRAAPRGAGQLRLCRRNG